MKIPKKCFLNRLCLKRVSSMKFAGILGWQTKINSSNILKLENLRILQRNIPHCPTVVHWLGLITALFLGGMALGGSPLRLPSFKDIWIFGHLGHFLESLNYQPVEKVVYIYRGYTRSLRWYKIGQPSNTTYYGWFFTKAEKMLTGQWSFFGSLPYQPVFPNWHWSVNWRDQ